MNILFMILGFYLTPLFAAMIKWVSGLTSSTNNLVLSGMLLYIDDDTSASGIVGGELLGFSGEFAELYAGKGLKTLVIKKARQQGVFLRFDNFYELTPKALNIFYGGSYSTGVGYNRLEFKNQITSNVPHKWKAIAENVGGYDIEITVFNGRNSTFSEIPVNGEDWSSVSIEITPEPVNPGDVDEVLVRIDQLTA